MIDLPTFGARVKWLRELVHPVLPQRSLDTLTGLHQGHIWQIERGDRENPTFATIDAIRTVFGVSTDWLLYGTGELPDKNAVIEAVQRAKEVVSKKKQAPDAHAATGTEG